jgi:glycerol kinase
MSGSQKQQYIVSIDQGTSSTRCIVFDQTGGVVASSQREHTQYYPAPGHVEHDVGEIWAATRHVVEVMTTELSYCNGRHCTNIQL